MRTFDLAVIGAGTAGLAAYRAAREYTGSIVLIDKGPLGTTCARVGCMPSKLLIAAAKQARTMASAAKFGVRPGEVTVDAAKMFSRLRRLRDDFVESTLQSINEIPDEHWLCGAARFQSPGRLKVGNDVIEAERIVIATGSRPVVPDPIREGTGGRFALVEDIFELEELPKKMVVFGAGVIGAEIATALAHLGVEVHCYSKGGKVGFLSDEDVSDEALSIMSENLVIDADAEFGEMGWDGDVFRLELKTDGGTREERFDYVLVATGREAALDDLCLEESGCIISEKGVPEFCPVTRRCKGDEDMPVFIAGDADDGEMTIPVAERSGEAAGANAGAWPDMPGVKPQTPMRIAFTEPSMASVGKTFRELKDRRDLAIGCASFHDQGRAKIDDRALGLIRLYAEKPSGKLLGAEMIAPDAEHLGHLLAWGIEAGLGVKELSGYPIYHPVIEQGLMTALKDAASKL
ncbi:dihydrolipoyl dehydrogenase [Parvularcula maris]|uniref:Dihydrolipoyl dehydrogenase n=1 Tax=Parvularcula maris TaxID=2965077 RepID=A0A9X2RHD7_9PROT|nr:dihydrolipoyl dehydrogenase [Parvularcula maris]MCQ8184830.1 dihydrolipoyl dehydrogenase [Parvularcula maris]